MKALALRSGCGVDLWTLYAHYAEQWSHVQSTTLRSCWRWANDAQSMKALALRSGCGVDLLSLYLSRFWNDHARRKKLSVKMKDLNLEINEGHHHWYWFKKVLLLSRILAMNLRKVPIQNHSGKSKQAQEVTIDLNEASSELFLFVTNTWDCHAKFNANFLSKTMTIIASSVLLQTGSSREWRWH